MFSACVGPSFECATTLTTDDFTGKGVTVLILVALLFQPSFLTALLDNFLGGFEILMAYDCLMMVPNEVLVFLSVIVMTVEMIIGISLLEDDIAGIFFIMDHIIYCC